MNLSQLLLLVGMVLCFNPSQVYGQKGWEFGARAGVIGVPYALSANRLGAGGRIGLSIRPKLKGKTNISVLADYRVVNNLQMGKLEKTTIVLPEGLARRNELLSVSGFAGLRLGLRLDRTILNFRRGVLKVNFAPYAELMTAAKATQQSNITSSSFLAVLVDSEQGTVFGVSNSSGATSTSRNRADSGRVVLAGGIGLMYEFTEGLQVELGFLADVTDRFSLFTGSSDARLTQLFLGFNYPLN
jgi:hypothetical protein